MTLSGREIDGAHTVCHSWVGYQFSTITGGEKYSATWKNNYKKGAEPFLTLTCHSRSRSKASSEATDAIILWMASDESPFSQFILNRDDKDSLVTGGAVILCGPGGASHAQAMWMCKVLRYSVEGSRSLDTWMTLYRAGVNPVLAVLVSTYISSVSGATFSYASVTDHVSVFSGYGAAREVDVPALLSSSLDPDAASTSTVFRSGGKLSPKSTIEGKIEGFCKPFEKDDGWGGKVRGVGATEDELVSRVLQWQSEFAIPTPPPPAPTSSTVYLDLDL